ncbi:solute carrier organic anion transporter family member 4C1-like isoform X1 [Amphiura filiformis]|uniref:solute carrier organic anion transporter family member 4C1-like isoform X1 n=1 Tax=Amphiura filiformis TaxID=82378 RepID=UPI003B219014
MNGISSNTHSINSTDNMDKLPNGTQLRSSSKNNVEDSISHEGDISSDYGDDDDDDVFVEYRYGWCGWSPDWIQRFNQPQWLLVFLCLYALVQGLVINGLINVVISTLERRFDLPSTQTGVISSTYDISTALLVVFVSYYGERSHKARWVAFGCVIMAVGSVVFALPHFLTGLHTNISGSLLCVEDSPNECQRSSDSVNLSNYLYVFLAAQVIHGIGCTPLFSLGVSLMDESVTVHQSSLYLGIFFAMSTLGPAIGYMGGGSLLNIYTDIGQVDISSLDVTPNDPGWVGAWWLGFLIFGICASLLAIPIGGFPKELPATQKVRAKKVSQAHKSSSDEKVTNPSFGNQLSDFPRAIKYLFQNPTFVFLVFTSCAEGLIVSGMATFGPKVIETQFGKTAGQASLLMGLCTVPGGIFGTFLGGYLSKRWQLKVRGMLKLCCGSIVVALIAMSGILLRCPQEYLVGVNVDYSGNEMVSDRVLSNDCNTNCGCPRTEFNPICGDNGMEYFDPCFAGCTVMSDDAQSFAECSCLELTNTNSTLTASSGKCPKDCGYLPLFLVTFVIVMIFHFMSGVPGISCLLRSVPESQRSLALGVQWLILRLLGTIPGPIVYGATLDTSCLLWQETCDGDQGSCFLYNAKTISWKMFLLGFGFQFTALVFFLMALWSYRSPDDDVEAKDNENKTIGKTDSELTADHADDHNQNDKRLHRLISQSSQAAILPNESLPDYDIDGFQPSCKLSNVRLMSYV